MSPVFGNLVSPLMDWVFGKALRLVNEPLQVFSDYSAVAGSAHHHVPTTMRVILELLRGGGKCSWEQ